MQEKWNKEILQKTVKESISVSETLRKLGLNVSSGNYKTFYKYTKLWNININHFDPDKARRQVIKGRMPLDNILIKYSTYNRGALKKRLLKEGLLKYKCSICNISNWQNKNLTLQLDHINGNKFDNQLHNLRLLCPNCHSQTITYAGKSLKKKYLCNICKSEKKSKYGKICRNCVISNNKIRPTKIDWPPTKELIKMVNESNYSAVARNLGVSDNAIRKRIKNHSAH